MRSGTSGRLPLHDFISQTVGAVGKLEGDQWTHPPALNVVARMLATRRAALHRTQTKASALHLAAATNAPPELLEFIFLLDPAAATSANNEGMLPLHKAVHREATVENVRLVHGMHREAVTSADSRGLTPLHVCMLNKCTVAVVRYLLESDPAGQAVRQSPLPLYIGLHRRGPHEALIEVLLAYPEAASFTGGALKERWCNEHTAAPATVAHAICNSSLNWALLDFKHDGEKVKLASLGGILPHYLPTVCEPTESSPSAGL